MLDIYDGQPQVKALVEFLDSEYKVLSDDKGGFIIEGICPGEYNLKISHPGCIDSVSYTHLTLPTKRIV